MAPWRRCKGVWSQPTLNSGKLSLAKATTFSCRWSNVGTCMFYFKFITVGKQNYLGRQYLLTFCLFSIATSQLSHQFCPRFPVFFDFSRKILQTLSISSRLPNNWTQFIVNFALFSPFSPGFSQLLKYRGLHVLFLTAYRYISTVRFNLYACTLQQCVAIDLIFVICISQKSAESINKNQLW